MIGWATHLTQEAVDAHRTSEDHVIGVVVDKNFPDEELLASLSDGAARFADAVFVVRGTDTRAREALASVGVEAVEAPFVPRYKRSVRWPQFAVKWLGMTPAITLVPRNVVVYDHRKLMRDLAIIDGCTRVIVYKDANSATSKWWSQDGHRTDHVRVVEHGTQQKRYRKGRKPQ